MAFTSAIAALLLNLSVPSLESTSYNLFASKLVLVGQRDIPTPEDYLQTLQFTLVKLQLTTYKLAVWFLGQPCTTSNPFHTKHLNTKNLIKVLTNQQNAVNSKGTTSAFVFQQLTCFHFQNISYTSHHWILKHKSSFLLQQYFCRRNVSYPHFIGRSIKPTTSQIGLFKFPDIVDVLRRTLPKLRTQSDFQARTDRTSRTALLSQPAPSSSPPLLHKDTFPIRRSRRWPPPSVQPSGVPSPPGFSFPAIAFNWWRHSRPHDGNDHRRLY